MEETRKKQMMIMNKQVITAETPHRNNHNGCFCYLCSPATIPSSSHSVDPVCNVNKPINCFFITMAP